jgi:cell division septal protein FtsQ
MSLTPVHRRHLLERLLRLSRRLLWVGVLVGIGLAAVLVVVRGRSFLLQSTFFAVQWIEIEGVGKNVEAKMRTLLEEEDFQNLLLLSSRETRLRLLDIPEVREVAVRKQFPDTLLVMAAERRPILILVGEVNHLVDRDFVAMGEIEGEAFLNSPLPLISAEPMPAIVPGRVVADEGLRRAWIVVSELRAKAPDVALRLGETHYDAEGNVTLFFEGGAELRLGQRTPSQVLPVLDAFWRETQGFSGIEYAELGYRNQVAFRRRPELTTQPVARSTAPSHR